MFSSMLRRRRSAALRALAKYGGSETEATHQIGYLGLLMLYFFPMNDRPSESEVLQVLKRIRERTAQLNQPDR